MLLLSGDVVKGVIAFQCSAECASDSIAIQIRLAHTAFKRRSSIHCAIFDKEKHIAVMNVCACLRDYVNRTACRSPGLSRQALIYHLKLSNGFKGQFSTAGSGKFIVVIYSIYVNRITAWPETTKTESAVRQPQ